MKQAATTGANELRLATFCAALLLAGCGESNGSGTPPAESLARDWRYYVANPHEIEPMQTICREWAGSSAPAGAEPAVVAANCRAAAFAKSQLQLTK